MNRNDMIWRKKIELVTQINATGCVIACLAMITEKPFWEVNRDLGGQQPGMHDAVAYLCRNNVIAWPRYVDCLFWGSVYLLAAPSLNIPGGMHQMLIDLRDQDAPLLFDPNLGRDNVRVYTIDHFLQNEISFADSFEVLHAEPA